MFKSLYSITAKIGLSLGILSVAAGNLSAQQWQDVGGSGNLSSGTSSYNNLSIDGQGNYYVSYYDVAIGKGSVQKFNGTSWSYVGGSAGITTASTTYSSLSLDSSGKLYYTNQWAYPNAGMEVRKFDGTSWSQLPNAFTATTNYQASTVAPNGTLFVYGSVDSGTVKRFVNGAWEQVGATGIAVGVPYNAEMVIGTNGKVYVCHNASGVKVYENSLSASSTDVWTLVGGTSVGSTFTEGVNATSDIAIGADNKLYVVYSSNAANNRKLNVKKFNGTDWEQVGNANFGISNDLYNVSIAVTPAGKLYAVASGWSVNGGKNTVYEFDATTNTWVTFGGDFVSDGTALYNDLQYDTFNNSLVLTYSQSGVKVKRISLTPACNNTDPGTTPGDIGCVSFTYKGQPVSYTTVRGQDGKVWLQQNLGSTQVATSQTDTNSYGDLFQWGRWDDGHQLRNSLTTAMPSVNNPSGLAGITAFIVGSGTGAYWWNTNALTDKWSGENTAAITSETGVDPCRAIGQGWRLPTQADWTTAVSSEGISNPSTAYNSKLKLPAAGNRSPSDASFTYEGQRGYYWSSDVSGSGGKYLYIGTTIANAASGGPRAQGQSLRCIKETSALGTSDIRRINFGIYPNPTKDILNIKVDSLIDTVNVTNMVGQRLNVQFTNNQINLQGFPNGMYIVELKLKNGQTISKKVIKN
ncbi:T9SS type A sorting domain-containing protein [Chryseobacterium gwangjuense]|uniref:T9SS type A sorting domain-containing protein n=1 Tax=Chryseobacterium gwangjuense TaxID=1069980 RepID=UPI001E5C9750|nr:T9SS type A sorting domain-containing protein [Chryseobacterium gwangjuense]MCE3074979.1 T9SS type A sorting domain-containing protein [Chryseobacterium gwangjuense]